MARKPLNSIHGKTLWKVKDQLEPVTSNNNSRYKENNNATPDIHELFAGFNQRFFWGRLDGVEVRWSPRMTLCAGVCVYRRKEKYCSVRLSSPLLKLRPHSDLVDTLLHEMIHAYLFVTGNNTDRNAHGPEFQKHKDRINEAAGTKISVYHSFHAEVKFYRQHWWRCSGRCQNEAPYFGMVKRSMNRAPGPNDRWWASHEAHCGGTFNKIREPAKHNNKEASAGEREDNNLPLNGNEIVTPLKKFGLENITGYVDLTSPDESPSSNKQSTDNAPTVGLRICDTTIDLTDESSKCPVCLKSLVQEALSEHLESCEGLLGLFDGDNGFQDVIDCERTDSQCPICELDINGDIKSHLGECLNNSGIIDICNEPVFSEIRDNGNSFGRNSDDKYVVNSIKVPKCPLCNLSIENNFKSHLVNCLNSGDMFNEENVIEISDDESPTKTSDGQRKSATKYCPSCGLYINGDLKSHIYDCLKDYVMFDGNNNVDGNGTDLFTKTYDIQAEDLKENRCPVCNLIIKDNIKNHVDECLNTSGIFEEAANDIDADESMKVYDSQTIAKASSLKSSKKSCPVCSLYVDVDIESHIEDCLNTSGILEEAAIEISDTESPTKIFDNHTNFL